MTIAVFVLCVFVSRHLRGKVTLSLFFEVEPTLQPHVRRSETLPIQKMGMEIMIGAGSADGHSGFQSELLAQYAFATWGTVISTPNAEDHGIDLHCTLTDRVGHRLWAKSPYTVQVKSNFGAWKFSGAESIRWLLEHPLPLFLCIVLKDEARILVYQTFPRFWVAAFRPHWDSVILKPIKETHGERIFWKSGDEFSLSAPILDFRFDQLLDAEFQERARETLTAWVNIENANLTRRRAGLSRFEMPLEYKPNEPPTTQNEKSYYTSDFDNEPVPQTQFDDAAETLSEGLEFICSEFRKRGDMVGAVKAALLIKHLCPWGMVPRLDDIDNAFDANPKKFTLTALHTLDEMIRKQLVSKQ